MALGRSLSEILDECIERVGRGETVDVCVADYPEFAIELRDELEAAVLFQGAFDYQPSSDAKRAARLRMFEALERRQNRRFRFRIALPKSLFATGTRIAATAAVAVVALVTSGTGTVFAAQSANPGDLLYGIKRTGEQVQLAFAFSETREADVLDSLIERRIEELNVVTEEGREEFVADLVEELIDYTTRAQTIASAPVEAIVDTLPAFDLEPTLVPAGTEPTNVTPIGTPEPTATPGPVGRADKQVSATPVLTLSGELDTIDERLRSIESDVLEERSREELAKLRKSLNQTRQQLNSLMNRADQVHNPDVVERPVDQDEPPEDTDATPTPTPEVEDALSLNLGGRTTATITDVVFQQEDGVLVRVDVLMTLNRDGSRLLAQITRGGTRLLKDGKGASVQSLRIGQQVVLSVQARTGEVVAISILDTPKQESNNKGKSSSRSSVDTDDDSSMGSPVVASRGKAK
jgi:hypothetical protein